jgi:hypothetical protein
MDMDVDEVDFTDEQFLMDLVKQWVQDNPEIFIDEESEIHTRNRGPKIDYWQTEWGRLILDPSTMDPKSRNGLKFRRRFRVPFPLFHEVLVPICREKNIFDIKEPNKVS